MYKSIYFTITNIRSLSIFDRPGILAQNNTIEIMLLISYVIINELSQSKLITVDHIVINGCTMMLRCATVESHKQQQQRHLKHKINTQDIR